MPDHRDISTAHIEGRLGGQYDAVMRIVHCVLARWCKYSESDNRLVPDYLPRKGLRLIYFDKLVELVFRLWDEVFIRDGLHIQNVLRGKPSVLSEQADTLVTFPCPMKPMPAKHGRGRANTGSVDGRCGTLWFPEIAYGLERSGICGEFEFRIVNDQKEEEKSRGKKLDIQWDLTDTVTGGPNLPYQTTVYSGYQFSLAHIANFTTREKQVLDRLAGSIERLDPEQIRALGTHANPVQTIEDIQKEFRDIIGWRGKKAVLTSIIELLKNGDPLGADAQTLAEYMREAWLKASDNRAAYASGWAEMRRGLTSDTQLLQVYDQLQEKDSTIWDHAEVIKLRTLAGKAYALAQYLHAIFIFSEHPNKRTRPAHDGEYAWRLLDEAQARANEYGPKGLCFRPVDVFEGQTSKIRMPLLNHLISVLKEMESEIARI